MNDELLFERLASHDGPAELDRAFEDRLYSVLQGELRRRRSSRPLLLMAAALLLATTIGAVAVGSGLINPPWENHSLIPVPSQPASAAPIPVLRATPEVSGRYFLYGGGLAYDWYGLDITASVPVGWQRGNPERAGFGIVRGDPPVRLLFWVVDNLMTDACHPASPPKELDPPVGLSVADLAAALASLPAVDAANPADVSLGGWSGTRIDLRIRDDLACGSVELWTWYETPSRGEAFSMWGVPGEYHQVWILDVDGLRLVIDAASPAGTPQHIQSELREIVDSIEIAPRR